MNSQKLWGVCIIDTVIGSTYTVNKFLHSTLVWNPTKNWVGKQFSVSQEYPTNCLSQDHLLSTPNQARAINQLGV